MRPSPAADRSRRARHCAGRCLFIAVSLLALAGKAFAADEPRARDAARVERGGTVRTFRAEELGRSIVPRAIVAHPDGRVFVGHDAGLLVCEDEKWRPVPEAGAEAVHALGVDEDGRVWFVGMATFGFIDDADREAVAEVRRVEFPPGTAERGDPRRRVVFDGEGAVLVFGGRGVVARVDGRGGVRIMLVDTFLTAAHEWQGNVYVQGPGAGYRITREGAERLPESDPLWKPSATRTIRGLWPDEDGDVWLISNTQQRRLRPDGTVRASFDFSRHLGEDRINHAVSLRNGLMAFGTQSHGAWIVRPDGRFVVRLDAERGLGTGGDHISGLACGEDGRLWIAHAGGVACIEPRAGMTVRNAEPPGRSAPPRFTGTPLTRVFTARDIGSARQRAVAVHPNGCVYVGSDEGLHEFDGVTWRTVEGTRRRTIYDVAIDAAGRIYYGSTREFGVLVPDARGVLKPQPLHVNLPEAERDIDVVNEVLASGSAVFFRISGRKLVVRLEPSGELRPIRLEDTPVRLLEGLDGIYAQCRGGVYRLAVEQAEPLAPGSFGLQGSAVRTVRAMWPDGAGGLWQVGAKGLRRWRGAADAPLVSRAIERLLGSDVVTAGCALGDGTFALGTRQHGVLRVDAEGNLLARYHEERGLGQGSNTVSDLATDAEGGLWVAHHGGMSRIQVRGAAALHGAAVGLRGTVAAIAVHRGRLHVGTSQGLFVRDPRSGRFEARTGVVPPVLALVNTPDGLVMGGNRLMIVRNDDVIESIDVPPMTINAVATVPRDPDRFVASTMEGLWVYRREAGKWRREGRVDGVRDFLLQLVFDDAGWLWATRGNRDVVRIDWRGGVRLDAPVEALDADHGLPNFFQERQGVRLLRLGGVIGVARAGELLRHEAATDRFVPETRIPGLAPHEVTSRMFSLAEDEFLLLRTTTDRRLGVVRRTGPGAWRMEWQPYSGCESVEAKVAFADPANEAIWFGDENLASVEPAADRFVAAPPGARVRRVTTVDGNAVIWGGAGAMPRDALTPAQNALQFQFAAPSFRADAEGVVEVQYRTKLDGFDREWSAWSTEKRRTYTNLPPGSFAFRVQARGDDFREGPETSYAFRVLPPWWRTWWFLGLASVAGVGSIAGVTRWLANRALQRRVALLEAQSAVERERLRLARDLHDEVGSGLGRVILFAGEAERVKSDAAKLAAAHARIQGAAQDLVQHAREIVWAVSPQHDALASVIERLGDYADETLRAAGIACALELPRPETIPAVTLGSEARHSLFLALKEAVHNCVKYSEAKTAELKLAIVGNDFVVTLRDHGRGFAAGERRGSGHGTRNIVARAEALGGSAEIVSAVGQGTSVTIRVPLPAGKR